MRKSVIVLGALLRLATDSEIVRLCRLLAERAAVVLGRLS